jgi:hypothetical protein
MSIKNCNTFFSFVFLVTVLTLCSCAKKIRFQNSPVVPAAHGTVKVKKDNNNNYSISIHITDLAEADRLTPPRRIYIVWMDAKDVLSKNIGQIGSSGNLLSSRKKSSFQTVSPIKPYRIFITAEDDANTMYPGTQVILATDIF